MQFLKKIMILNLIVSSAFAIAMDDVQSKIVEKAADSSVVDASVFIECSGFQIKVPNSSFTCKEVYVIYGALLQKNKEKSRAKDKMNAVVENTVKNNQVD